MRVKEIISQKFN